MGEDDIVLKRGECSGLVWPWRIVRGRVVASSLEAGRDDPRFLNGRIESRSVRRQ